ncbi:MAG: PQQ-binding-like beta-propeller repeat protein [Treponema sp.]|nr:PQQ-binding-like beta-propeller repeat protein [Treponema sp.]
MNMYNKTYRACTFLFFLLLFLAFCQSVFSESENITLSMYNANWNCIVEGEAIVAPKETSNGFIVLTDGKTLLSCSETGDTLWEKKLKNISHPLCSVLPDDFIAVVNGKKTLELLNASGSTLWTRGVDFEITEEPKQGRDGRIFVRGEKNIACFGINGICKWSIQVQTDKSIPFLELNDGSLFVVYNNGDGNGENKKFGAFIISPFGNITNTVHFSTSVHSAFSCEQGVVVGFHTGEFALYAKRNKKTEQIWSVPLENLRLSEKTYIKGMAFFPLKDTVSAMIIEGSSFSTTVVIFENSTGIIQSLFQPTMSLAELMCYSRAMAGDAVFLCNKSIASIFDFTGTVLWSANLPSLESRKTAWNYIAYTKNDFLLICSKSWMLSAYRTLQTNSRQTKKDAKKNLYPYYENFYDDISPSYTGLFSESLMTELTNAKREKILESGFYAEKEKDFSSSIFSALNAYKNMVSSEVSRSAKKGSLVYDKKEFECMLHQGCLLGGRKTSDLLAEILSYKNDYDTLLLLTKAAGNAGYDPDEKLFSALEASLLKIPSQNSLNIVAVSDALYEICRFMGKKELYQRCIKTLSSLISNKYDTNVNESARKNLSKIAKLNSGQ